TPETDTAHELDKVVGREAREFLQKYGPTILVSAGLAIAVALGFGAWQNHKQGQLERAERLLSGQPMPEEKLGPGITIQRLQMVVDRYPKTPSAPLALLALAAQFFSQGQYEPARAAYLKFEQLYPQHIFAPAAELGRVHCAEAAFMTDIALAGYEKFIAAHPDYYLTPQAIFGKARCLEVRGALDNARITYEDFLAKNPQSPWESQVKNALQLLDMKKRALTKGQAVSGQAPSIPAVIVKPPAPVAPKPAPAK
ncbi:MAG: tetratricopeptide repeat protein, partial [Kiritimatiellaeota bacterium]|nr:tetratricopeptide repeat protein [Kiritimatiellota bacterium]